MPGHCTRCGAFVIAFHNCRFEFVGECECGWSVTSGEIMRNAPDQEEKALASLPGAMAGSVAGAWSGHRDREHKGQTDVSVRIFLREKTEH